MAITDNTCLSCGNFVPEETDTWGPFCSEVCRNKDEAGFIDRMEEGMFGTYAKWEKDEEEDALYLEEANREISSLRYKQYIEGDGFE